MFFSLTLAQIQLTLYHSQTSQIPYMETSKCISYIQWSLPFYPPYSVQGRHSLQQIKCCDTKQADPFL